MRPLKSLRGASKVNMQDTIFHNRAPEDPETLGKLKS